MDTARLLDDQQIPYIIRRFRRRRPRRFHGLRRHLQGFHGFRFHGCSRRMFRRLPHRLFRRFLQHRFRKSQDIRTVHAYVAFTRHTPASGIRSHGSRFHIAPLHGIVHRHQSVDPHTAPHAAPSCKATFDAFMPDQRRVEPRFPEDLHRRLPGTVPPNAIVLERLGIGDAPRSGLGHRRQRPQIFDFLLAERPSAVAHDDSFRLSHGRAIPSAWVEPPPSCHSMLRSSAFIVSSMPMSFKRILRNPLVHPCITELLKNPFRNLRKTPWNQRDSPVPYKQNGGWAVRSPDDSPTLTSTVAGIVAGIVAGTIAGIITGDGATFRDSHASSTMAVGRLLRRGGLFHANHASEFSRPSPHSNHGNGRRVPVRLPPSGAPRW